ncbi:MAG TPA: Rne/Rng family ribonuclease [Intrasporangium sp.]|uniref:Rne/Rng family ribonuclease n=1 Tax=Intrasporangium sp. TaxID=1925024 RepID=UPI002D766C71|nr:Rne/Rng family ribonuclease [Intrasporangium sp.]HET7398285.1 Rne/Rng family ribonuclease [Intrasporangium sp.]
MAPNDTTTGPEGDDTGGSFLPEPTELPTDAQTGAPTDAPPEAPTDGRTDELTEAPSEAPTDELTEAPTDELTAAPSEEPMPDAGAEPVAEAPAEKPAPRKRAPRKTAKNAAAMAEVPQAATDAAPSAPGEGEPTTGDGAEAAVAAPVKKAARKRATRKVTTPAEPPAALLPDEPLVDQPVLDALDAALGMPRADVADVADVAAPHEAAPERAPQEAGDRGEAAEPDETPSTPTMPTFSVLFQPPDPGAATAAPPRRRRSASAPAAQPVTFEERADETEGAGMQRQVSEVSGVSEAPEVPGIAEVPGIPEASEDELIGRRSRRRRGGKGRRPRAATGGDEVEAEEYAGEPDREAETGDEEPETAGVAPDSEQVEEEGGPTRRRRRRRRTGSADALDEGVPTGRVRELRAQPDEPTGVRGSTRLEAKKQRRREGREAGRRRTVITEAEFLARRESVDRVMVVRNKDGRTQMGVLEDGVLVEHYIDQANSVSMAGNIYLGRVQNVLPSMEAAFVDIGKGRNAVLYAGEVNWDAAGLEVGQPKRIENALESGQTVLVQVTKDPIGHKGARLTSQISLPGRYLVYVPNSSMTGISRKLPDTERARLKKILREVVPEDAGVIVRTAAEGASEEELRADVERLTRTWADISARAEAASSPKAGKSKGRKKNGNPSGSSGTGTAPLLLHGEPDLTVRVIRDVFNEDFKQLLVSGEQAWEEIHPYITSVAPDLADRVTKWTGPVDLFTQHRVDEQLAKAMDRKVWLPSGGSLVIDRTEAMTVVDVNTGKFIGSGGNLEETVTKNNIEAAEEIVRQLRLRDIGGIIVIDFIDMVLESNRDLVVRRLLECLGRDRTKHQVAEVTSLGLVQMTRKRVGAGLIEVFSHTCEHCNGRGFIISSEPVDKGPEPLEPPQAAGRGRRGRRGELAASTGDGSGNGASPAEQPRPSGGPTAAQIAAAAHAAALKRGHAEEAAHAPARPEAAQPEQTQPEPVHPEPVHPEPVHPEQVHPEPVHPEPVHPEPAQPGPPQPEPAQPVLDQPQTVVPAAGARPRRRHGRVIAPAGPPRGAGGASGPTGGAGGAESAPGGDLDGIQTPGQA